jgi:signal transduction histidine kinase
MWNAFSFFNELKESERKKMQLWADAQHNVQENNVLNSDALINDVVLKVLQGNTTTPMILYSHKEGNYDIRNINKKKIDTLNLVKKFSNEYNPIEVYYNDELLQTIYYGNSPLINKIKYYPAVLILIMLLFFTAIYFFYRTSKASEQNKLWAGMAKETAHQIGTPLSSLVGWTEILKTENVNKEYIKEMEKDIDRLRTITERFSKVGSVPTMSRSDLVQETHLALDYLKSRSSKLIGFHLNSPNEPVMVKLNSQLYGWTIENLVKNSIDAMKGKGDITIEIEKNYKYAFVRITDTGKGISKRDFSKIFKPGFTSKKRGWGLGLSLAKRIIGEYHKGKIRVLKSNADKGTTMEIALRLLKD